MRRRRGRETPSSSRDSGGPGGEASDPERAADGLDQLLGGASSTAPRLRDRHSPSRARACVVSGCPAPTTTSEGKPSRELHSPWRGVWVIHAHQGNAELLAGREGHRELRRRADHRHAPPRPKQRAREHGPVDAVGIDHRAPRAGSWATASRSAKVELGDVAPRRAGGRDDGAAPGRRARTWKSHGAGSQHRLEVVEQGHGQPRPELVRQDRHQVRPARTRAARSVTSAARRVRPARARGPRPRAPRWGCRGSGPEAEAAAEQASARGPGPPRLSACVLSMWARAQRQPGRPRALTQQHSAVVACGGPPGSYPDAS